LTAEDGCGTSFQFISKNGRVHQKQNYNCHGGKQQQPDKGSDNELNLAHVVLFFHRSLILSEIAQDDIQTADSDQGSLPLSPVIFI
jgi:hypothetical protein